MNYRYCPRCAKELVTNNEGYPACECGFVHYDNPVPVVAGVIPIQRRFFEEKGMPATGIPEAGLVMVRRGQPPFFGEWCLPCGYMEKHGHPKNEVVREVLEETGIETRVEKLLCACNPAPGEVNQTVISYLLRPVGGFLRYGSDVSAVRVFSRDNAPRACFRSHQMLIDHWFAGELGELTGKDLLI